MNTHSGLHANSLRFANAKNAKTKIISKIALQSCIGRTCVFEMRNQKRNFTPPDIITATVLAAMPRSATVEVQGKRMTFLYSDILSVKK